MKIILADNTELAPVTVTGAPRTVQGVTRDALSFVFPVSAGLSELDAVFTKTACESITIVDDDGNEFIHKGYTIRAELKKQSEEVTPGDAETDAVYEDRVTVVMARRTYTESQIASLTDAWEEWKASTPEPTMWEQMAAAIQEGVNEV